MRMLYVAGPLHIVLVTGPVLLNPIQPKQNQGTC
jgi:hypothetical protein